MTTPENPVPQPAMTPTPLASWGQRFLGFLIDWAPLLILSILTFRSTALSTLLSIVSIAYIAYLGHLEGSTGQSPGKAMMGLKLVNKDGQILGSGTGIGRKFAHIVDSIVCGLGYLLPLVDAKRQTIADKLLDTYVLEGAEKKPFSIDLWTSPAS